MTIVLLHNEFTNGATIITEEHDPHSITRYRTRIVHREFWPIWTENHGMRSKTGYKTEQAALAGHDRIVRKFLRWMDEVARNPDDDEA